MANKGERGSKRKKEKASGSKNSPNKKQKVKPVKPPSTVTAPAAAGAPDSRLKGMLPFPFPSYAGNTPRVFARDPPAVTRSLDRDVSRDVFSRREVGSPERDVLRLARELAQGSTRTVPRAASTERYSVSTSPVSPAAVPAVHVSGGVPPCDQNEFQNGGRQDELAELKNQVIWLSQLVSQPSSARRNRDNYSAEEDAGNTVEFNLPVGEVVDNMSSKVITDGDGDSVSLHNTISTATRGNGSVDNGSIMPATCGEAQVNKSATGGQSQVATTTATRGESQADKDKGRNTNGDSKDDSQAPADPCLYEGISILEASNKADPVGKAVPKYWAETVANMFNRNIQKEELEKLEKMYAKPSNVPHAKAPRIYSFIWNSMSRMDRSVDNKYQKVQTAFSSAIVPLLHAVDLVNTRGEVDKRKVMEHLSAAMAFIGDASYTVSKNRREHVKSVLSKDYKELCSSEVKITDQLLGEDCEARIKKIKESSRSSVMSQTYMAAMGNKKAASSHTQSHAHQKFGASNSGSRSSFRPAYKSSQGQHGRQSFSASKDVKNSGKQGNFPKNWNFKKPFRR